MIKRQSITKLIESVFLLLMSIQVLLGCMWLFSNINILPRFGESAELIQASKDWILDEYMGILYPVCIRITSLAGDVTGISFCIFLYIAQVAAAFYAYVFFLKRVVFKDGAKNEKRLYLLAAYIVTFPPILQCHMSVLPYSFVSSVVLIMLAELKRFLTEADVSFTSAVIKLCLCWLLSALLLPDYSVIAACPVLVGFAVYGWKQRKRLLVLLLAAVLTLGCLGTTLALTQTPGSLHRIQKSVGAVMLSRFVWPYFEKNSFFWRGEMKDLFEDGEFDWISLYPERVMYDFGPKLEAAVGKTEANEIYWEMAVDSALFRKKEVLGELGRDLLANLTAPVSMQLQLEGTGVSYTGWNYERMKENAPVLTKYYVSFAMYAFDFMMLIAVGVLIYSRCKGKTGCDRSVKTIFVLSVMMIVFWYTLIGNGMQNYLKVAPISILWCMSLIYGFRNICSKSCKERYDVI